MSKEGKQPLPATFTILELLDLYIYRMLIHENNVFELQVETKLEVCDPASLLTQHVVTKGA